MLVFGLGEPVLLAAVDVVVAVHLLDVHRVAQRCTASISAAVVARPNSMSITAIRNVVGGDLVEGGEREVDGALDVERTSIENGTVVARLLAQMFLDPLLGVALVRRAPDPVLARAARRPTRRSTALSGRPVRLSQAGHTGQHVGHAPTVAQVVEADEGSPPGGRGVGIAPVR